MKWCAPRSWWSAIWISISPPLSWPDTCAVWVIREPGRHKGSCILISTVAYLILIRILQLGHCHCFSSTVKSRETYETEMIPWRRRLIESSPYHWCALIHPIKIFNLLSPILKGWAGKGSCQEALLPLYLSVSLFFFCRSASIVQCQCSWWNPTLKIRMLFPVISGSDLN